MWLGQTCNLRCYFCYFSDRIVAGEHPEHPFMPLGKAKEICKTLVEVYGNNSIDIQGGEPTIYPHIEDLLLYCNEIGLKPTLITNAVSLSDRKRCRRLRNAEVFDLLISLHGLGETYDSIVRIKGASKRQMKALDNILEEGIPFRVNITLTKEALVQIDEVVAIARERGARSVNFIAFNPFIDQSKDSKRDRSNIPLYAASAARLLPIIDQLEESGIEVNVRYMPFCVFPEKYRKYVQNFQQIVYDLHEWESAGEVWSGAPPQRRAKEPLSKPIDFFARVMQGRAEFLAAQSGIGRIQGMIRRAVRRQLEGKWPGLMENLMAMEKRLRRETAPLDGQPAYSKRFYLPELGEVAGFSDLEYAYKEFRVLMPKTMHPYSKCPTCVACDINGICDGFHRDYAETIGFEEATACLVGCKVYDPRHYMYDQLKVVEEQEYDWALP